MQPKPEVFLETNRLSQSVSLWSNIVARWLASYRGWEKYLVEVYLHGSVKCSAAHLAHPLLSPVQLAACPPGCLGGLAGGLVDRMLAWSRAMVKSG